MKEQRVGGLACILVLTVILFAGCGDDSTSTPSTPTVSQETAQQQSAAAMEFIDGLVNSIDQVVIGDFTGGLGSVAAVRRRSAPFDIARDDACLYADCLAKPVYANGAWSAACINTSTDCSFNASVFVKFQDAGGNAQQEPDPTTDKLTYNVDVAVDYYVAGTPQRAADYVDVVLGLDSDISVDAMQTAVWRANGSGRMDFDIRAEQQGQTYAAAASLGWSYILSVPADGVGCPTGTVTITIGQYTATAVYDGKSGSYTLTLYEGGNQVHQETGVSSC